MCQQWRGESSIPISWPLWTENRAQLSLFWSYNVQLAIILFSMTWPIYIYVYSFPVSWINFPKYWTECCSPSSFLVETLWSPKTMLSIKFPEVWISKTANTFCLCVLWKACITWHFWTTNRKLTFSWKITLQGAIPPLNDVRRDHHSHIFLARCPCFAWCW